MATADEYRPLTPEELIKRWKDSANDDFLVEGLIPNGSLVLFGGEPKAGKSVILTNLAVSVASGLPWLGRRVNPGPVLWCAFEESLAERAEILAAYVGIEFVPIYTLFAFGKYLDDDDLGEGVSWLWDMVKLTKAKLVVIDPLMAAMKDGEFDRPSEARAKLTALKKMAEMEGIVIILIHHLNKSFGRPGQNRLSGSHQLAAASSASWTMQSRNFSDNRIDIDLYYWARIIGKGTVKVKSMGITEFEEVTPIGNDEAPQVVRRRRPGGREEILRLVRSDPKKLWTTAEVVSLSGKGTSTVNEIVQDLERMGILERSRAGGAKSAFRLVVADPAEDKTVQS